MMKMMTNMPLPTNIRVASYNIRKCIGLDRRRRPGRIVDVINAIGADVIALQEADRRLGPRPAAITAEQIARDTDFRALEIDPDSPSIGWHGNALLVRKGLQASEVRRVELPGTEPRGAISARVGGRFSVVATHLGLLRRDRRRQLDAIVEHLNGARTNAVILGDFNEWSQNRGLEPLDLGFRIHSPGLSYHAARPVAALDRFALGDGLALTDAGVVETPLSRIASDHLPIWADVGHDDLVCFDRLAKKTLTPRASV